MFCNSQSMFCTFLVKFITKYLIIFDAIVDGIILLISFFRLLQVYRKKIILLDIDLVYFLQPCVIYFFDLIISLYMYVFLRIFYKCKIMSSENKGSFTSSFLIWILIFFTFLPNCPIKQELNQSVENRHPYLVLDLRVKTFSLSLLSMMLAVGFFFFWMLLVRL